MAVMDATKENFQELVGSGLVLVDVWADSLPPVRGARPTYGKHCLRQSESECGQAGRQLGAAAVHVTTGAGTSHHSAVS
jgi:hypothetical protein